MTNTQPYSRQKGATKYPWANIITQLAQDGIRPTAPVVQGAMQMANPQVSRAAIRIAWCRWYPANRSLVATAIQTAEAISADMLDSQPAQPTQPTHKTDVQPTLDLAEALSIISDVSKQIERLHKTIRRLADDNAQLTTALHQLRAYRQPPPDIQSALAVYGD